jgi:outer membrane receptor protein involved in Fe transport
VQLFGTFSYIDGKFGDDIVNGTFRNQRFRLQPKVTASFGAFIDFQLSDNLKLDITPSITYTSKLFFEAPNAPRNGVALSQSKYALVNLRAGLEIGEEGRYRIEAFVTNLTDKEFLIDAGNTGATFGSTTIIPGAPRFAGVEAIVKF